MVDFLVLAVAWSMGGMWMVNTQVAYLTSSLVMGASMFSYARMVRRQLDDGALLDVDERDTLDKLEDPYDLYGEESLEPPVPDEAVDADTLKAAIQDEKARLKSQRRSIGQTLRDSRASMSVYRLVAYGLLVFGFFYLNGNHLFRILPYIIGLGIPIAVVVVTLMTHKEPT
jgi:hypothetical protein